MNLQTLIRLTTPKPGNHVSRLPTKSAQTNAALIASIMKAKEGETNGH